MQKDGPLLWLGWGGAKIELFSIGLQLMSPN